MACANVLYGRLVSKTSQDTRTTVIIWETGELFGLTQFKINFIDYLKCNITVKEVAKFNTVIGIGTAIHKFVSANGKYVLLT